MIKLTRLPRPVLESYEWQEAGLCGSAEVDLFFVPESVGRREKLRRERQAKLLCARCPVLDRCREHALTVGEPFGIWGGLSAYERRQLRDRGKVA